MDGLLLVDKPFGWTSHDVVAKVRSVLRQTGYSKVKVGHTGTLDPFATGLLVLVVGEYCKRAHEFSKLDKAYEVTMKLGQTSTTGDPEGEITQVSDHKPTKKKVQNIIKKFSGAIKQTPPAYSAIKVDGKRAYELARQGKKVELTARKVTIHGFEDLNYKYPTVSFTVSVSSGTYIRSLVEDIGRGLGTGAYTSALRRTIVGDFSVERSTQVTGLTPENITGSITST